MHVFIRMKFVWPRAHACTLYLNELALAPSPLCRKAPRFWLTGLASKPVGPVPINVHVYLKCFDMHVLFEWIRVFWWTGLASKPVGPVPINARVSVSWARMCFSHEVMHACSCKWMFVWNFILKNTSAHEKTRTSWMFVISHAFFLTPHDFTWQSMSTVLANCYRVFWPCM